MKNAPVLDPGFVPAVVWNRRFRAEAAAVAGARSAVMGVEQHNGASCRFELTLLPEEQDDRNFRYLERLVKSALWVHGGNRVLFDGPAPLLQRLRSWYAEAPTGVFDARMMSRIYDAPFEVAAVKGEEIANRGQEAASSGGHTSGCRIGFDLGGSDRKCAAVRDGEVVFSEEIKWDPYFQQDPAYHMAGIRDSLRRAAEHLPRVDAIGGSAAGVYVDNRVRVASLFRGVPDDVFKENVVDLFLRLRQEWGNVPFAVVNDGEVTALACAQCMNKQAILGIAMGTSMAVGYVTPAGRITRRLNELAFVPVDYCDQAPVDEWSGDGGCGVQYFSQQAVARLAPAADLAFAQDVPFAERLAQVQQKLAQGHEGSRKIFETIGVYFGHALAWYNEFYDVENLLVLGRLTSGEGGALINEIAARVLREYYPDCADRFAFLNPDEKMKRHGQAIAVASLPE